MSPFVRMEEFIEEARIAMLACSLPCGCSGGRTVIGEPKCDHNAHVSFFRNCSGMRVTFLVHCDSCGNEDRFRLLRINDIATGEPIELVGMDGGHYGETLAQWDSKQAEWPMIDLTASLKASV